MLLLPGIVASSQTSFSPLSIANCKVWLDASDTSTISLSGSEVTQWTDKTANGYAFTQGTSANRPLSGTRTQNSKNVIDFDGSNDRLVSTAAASTWNFLHDGTEYTFLVAFLQDLDGNGAFLGTSAANFGNRGATHGVLASDRIFSQVATGASGTRAVDADVTSFGDMQVFTYLSYTLKPSNATASERVAFRYKNGAANKPNSASGAVSASDATNTLALGDASNATTFPFNGVIGEILIYDVALSDANRGLLESYLATKWNIA